MPNNIQHEENQDKIYQVYRIVNLPIEALKAQM
jgi:hypothetical protein